MHCIFVSVSYTHLIDAKVKLVGPKTIERFAGGKAKRIVDLRDMR